MSAFAVTNDGRILQYPNCSGKSTWIRDAGQYWRVYYKSCTCSDCNKGEHEHLIADVMKNSIVSIGFERPICVAGRLLTGTEKNKLTDIKAWLERKREKGCLPKKLDATVLGVVAK